MFFFYFSEMIMHEINDIVAEENNHNTATLTYVKFFFFQNARYS